MQYFRIIFLLSIMLLLSACSGMGGYWEQGQWDQEHGVYLESDQYVAYDGTVRTYQQPRKYNITQKDLKKYDQINDQIAKRRQQILQQKQSAVEAADKKHTYPSATYDHSAPPAHKVFPSNGHNSRGSTTQGETNY